MEIKTKIKELSPFLIICNTEKEILNTDVVADSFFRVCVW